MNFTIKEIPLPHKTFECLKSLVRCVEWQFHTFRDNSLYKYTWTYAQHMYTRTQIFYAIFSFDWQLNCLFYIVFRQFQLLHNVNFCIRNVLLPSYWSEWIHGKSKTKKEKTIIESGAKLIQAVWMFKRLCQSTISPIHYGSPSQGTA